MVFHNKEHCGAFTDSAAKCNKILNELTRADILLKYFENSARFSLLYNF